MCQIETGTGQLKGVGEPDNQLRAWWGLALRLSHGTVFLVHAFRLTRPDQLDWFLDMVAAAKAQDSVRVVSTWAELFGAPAPPAPDVPDSSTTKLDR